jgi:hypothetical protein
MPMAQRSKPRPTQWPREVRRGPKGLPPTDIVSRISLYLGHRVAYEGTESSATPQFFAAIISGALCAFFGLELDENHQLIGDHQNPEAFAAWQARHSTQRH